MTTHESATCLACGCMCDDLRIATRDDKVVSVDPSCDRGQRWYQRQLSAGSCSIDGQVADQRSAMQHAADILRAAGKPLVFGLTGCTNEAVCDALELADRSRGIVDLALSGSARGELVAMQTSGKLTATLGEARNRAGLAVYFCCDPLTTHPRHQERYLGKQTQTLVIDEHRTQTADTADQFIKIQPRSACQALSTLRALATRQPATGWATATGVEQGVWAEVHERINRSQVVVVHYDTMPTDGGNVDEQLMFEALFAWIRAASRTARVFAIGLGSAGNATGAIEACVWQSGFPPPVNFARGYPEHCPVTCSAELLLQRKSVDAAIIVEPHAPLADILAPSALDQLRQIPTILLASAFDPALSPTVAIRTAAIGLEAGGTVHRVDNVGLPLRPALSSKMPPNRELLRELVAKVSSS